MKNFLFLLYLTTSFQIGFSQEYQQRYARIENERQSDYLFFRNDSIAELTINLGCFISKNEIKFSRKGNTITLYFDKNIEQYQIVDNALVDYLKRVIYVLAKDFADVPSTYIFYEDKFYELGQNQKFPKKLKKDFKTRNLKAVVIRGFEAYEKFGYKYSFGVLEVKLPLTASLQNSGD